ncbi:MAG: hypothetical protein P4K92_03735 [Candidatus Nitrosotalea sp.]|nr:hypothetical protein [Candidatus Nitrosotalea sp.]
MRIFHRKPTESETIKENNGDLVCEESIITDKERFGRVRKSMMKYLRDKYGSEIANRALWRVNRRRTEGYFRSMSQT